ncbi:Ornithine carbamoyltransferase, mitochondrial [Amphibalanus amphitrite]|uniref:ornithine carbamoyltransferase n=1 Tax=Amphibalanus amphitrite TaxID=1232801 RepID=A0A6A4UYY1_AMPAM|nr:Ornithine carbamoyltransferase, mitochondrial [Amphibalanus amphitrite]
MCASTRIVPHMTCISFEFLRPELRGRDFVNGDFTPSELKSVLWTAVDLRDRSTQKNENFSYMRGKSVTILQESGMPDTLSNVALVTAAHRLGGNVARMAFDSNKTDVSDLANCLSEVSSVIAVSCRHQAALQAAADGAAVPVVSLGSEQHDPLTALGELLAVLEHYSYLKRLTLAWVGPCCARLRSFLQLLPPLGIHLRYCCPQEEDLSPEELGDLVGRTVQHHTQFSRHESAAEATYRAHVLATTCHQYDQLQITEKHAAEADLDWTFVQDLPVSRSAVAAAVHGDRQRSLVAASAGCRHWLATALLTELCAEHERRTDRPDFEGERRGVGIGSG